MSSEDVEVLKLRILELEKKNEQQHKINRVLIERVENSSTNKTTHYAAFEHSVIMAEQVRERTEQLNSTLEKLRVSNRALTEAHSTAQLLHQRLIDAIESISDAFALFDSDRKLVLFNQRYRRNWEATGVEIEEGMTREEVRELIHKRVTIESNWGADETGKPGLICQLDSGRWIQIKERETSDGGVVVVHTDVTKLKQIETVRREQELAQKSRVLQRTVENLSQGVALVNQSGQLEVWNTRFVELTGVDGSKLANLPNMQNLLKSCSVDPLTPQSRDRYGRITLKLEQTLPDGTVIEIRTHPTLSSGYVNTYTDITERHQYAETLRESEQWIRLITDHIPAMVAYVGKDLRFQFTNRVYCERYERESEELYGKSIIDVHGQDQFDKLKPFIDRALTGESVTFEVGETDKHGNKHYMLRSYVPNLSDSGLPTGLVVLTQDVTERRETALALQQAYENMEQRVRERTVELTGLNQQLRLEIGERKTIESHLLEAKKDAERANLSKTKFLAATSHDLLQPLNAARLFIGALSERDLSDENAHLSRSASHSLDVVESLLETLVDISKLDAGVVTSDVTTFRVGDLLDNIANEYHQIAESSGLGFRYIESNAYVSSDSQLLGRVLRNFLSNSVRYTQKGKIVFGCRRKPNSLVIEVWDTGQGIPSAQLTDIFLEFKRLNSESRSADKGLGLGLAIVDKISTVLGHQVSVSSVEGKGSVFSVEVPYGRPVVAGDAGSSAEICPVDRLLGTSVWVIDNDPMICEGMRTLLSGWGCEVVTAMSLEDLRDSVDTRLTSPDLLVADYHLDDGVNGVDVVRELERELPDLPQILIITANYSPELIQKTKSLGYFMQNKPVRPMKLKTTLGYMVDLPERSL